MTPNFAVIGVDTPRFHWPRLWLPVFLLWIPAILLAPLLLLILLVLTIPACIGGISIWRAVRVLWGILANLPGTDVRVHADGNHVVVRIL
jgi:hypothetical protein